MKSCLPSVLCLIQNTITTQNFRLQRLNFSIELLWLKNRSHSSESYTDTNMLKNKNLVTNLWAATHHAHNKLLSPPHESSSMHDIGAKHSHGKHPLPETWASPQHDKMLGGSETNLSSKIRSLCLFHSSSLLLACFGEKKRSLTRAMNMKKIANNNKSSVSWKWIVESKRSISFSVEPISSVMMAAFGLR